MLQSSAANTQKLVTSMGIRTAHQGLILPSTKVSSLPKSPQPCYYLIVLGGLSTSAVTILNLLMPLPSSAGQFY